MSKYIIGESREQLVLFPDRLDSMIAADNKVRVIDAFVESLDMVELGLEKKDRKKVGAPGYDPKDMLKLYLYGYLNNVRSSRKLMKLTEINVEVMWLLKKLQPDFRCISDFRKDNIENLKKVFFEFNLVCKKMGLLELKKTSGDGTKIRAVNAKDKNFTLNKLDDRIKHLKEEIDEYLKLLEASEKDEVLVDELVNLEKLKARKKEYELYKEELEKSGESQKSLTDKDSKLMKNNGNFQVCYNNQVQVDCKSHLVSNFEVTNNPADFGEMSGLIKESEEVYDAKIEVHIADNGYSDRKDMVELLENGTRPEVAPGRGKDSFVLETLYEENEISEEEINSNEPEDIKKCLRAGVIPKKYEKSISKIEVKERVKTKTEGGVTEEIISELTEEELRDKAMEDNIFIRDKKVNKVYCPGGCILRQKAKYADGTIKYCNKLGCQNCKKPCTTAAFKEVNFKENQAVVVPKNNKNKENKTKKEENNEIEMSQKKVDISNFWCGLNEEKLELREDISIEEMLFNIYSNLEITDKKDARKILFTLENREIVEIMKEKGIKTKLSTINLINNDEEVKTTKVKEKIVLITYRIDKNELKERMSTSEHCHGTMKRNDDSSYFLLKGLSKVNGEMALYYTASNIRRAINLVGVSKLLEEFKNKVKPKVDYVVDEFKDNAKRVFTFSRNHKIIFS